MMDDFSKYAEVFVMTEKSEAKEKEKVLETLTEVDDTVGIGCQNSEVRWCEGVHRQLGV
jgi:hypothetical protein